MNNLPPVNDTKKCIKFAAENEMESIGDAIFLSLYKPIPLKNTINKTELSHQRRIDIKKRILRNFLKHIIHV